MPEVTIQIDDGLYQTLSDLLVDGVTPEDWLAMKAEQAIAQTRVQARQQGVQQAAQAAQAGAGGQALLTNEDVQQARQDAPDDD